MELFMKATNLQYLISQFSFFMLISLTLLREKHFKFYTCL